MQKSIINPDNISGMVKKMKRLGLKVTVSCSAGEDSRFAMKKDNKKIVLTGGCFDVLHIGHMVFLEKAKKKGDFLIVLLESDEKLKQKGNGRPVHPQMIRAKMLLALRFVNAVVLLPFITESEEYDEIINLIKPDIIAATKGDNNLDYKKRSAKLVGAKLVTVTPFIGEYSTTRILNSNKV